MLTRTLAALLSVGVLSAPAFAENTNVQTTTTTTSSTTAAPSAAANVVTQGNLRVELVDKIVNANHKSVGVMVTASGYDLVDAKQASPDNTKQAHLHYQLDDGVVIATTTPKLSFHHLTSGKHKIVVALADKNHNHIGTPAVIHVDIP